MTWLPTIIVVLAVGGMFTFGSDHHKHNRFKR